MSAIVRRESPISVRTIFLAVHPPPATLSERRAVFRVLRQHGAFHVFKKLNDPAAFIAVPTHHTTALTLIANSPLQFDYVNEHAHRGPKPPAGAASAGSPATASDEGQKKTFTVRIREMPEHPHELRNRESFIHGRWAELNDLFVQNSLSLAALRRSVPRNSAWNGLVDWETHGQVEGQVELRSWLSSAADFSVVGKLRKMNRPRFHSLSLMKAYEARNTKTAPEKKDGTGDGSGTDPKPDKTST